MSDFDKEAEREKLREKFEREEEGRETTEQMSELLLKGATMTNAHCSDCGDPIFRYDGQEFCPTCQKPIDRGGDEAAEQAETADDGGEAESQDDLGPSGIEVTEPSDDARVAFGGEAAEQAENGDAAGQADTATDRQSRPDSPSDQRTPADVDRSQASAGTDRRQPRPGTGGGQSRSETGDSRARPETGPSPGDVGESTGQSAHRAPSLDPAATEQSATDTQQRPRTETADGDLTAARAVLAQTVERFSRRARDANSPREAREYLEAAREAAETLEATHF